jgi:outer membrane protein TolC
MMFRGWRVALPAVTLLLAGCQELMRQTDRDVERLVGQRQQTALGRRTATRLPLGDANLRPGRQAYAKNPPASVHEIPASFSAAASQPASQPSDAAPDSLTPPSTRPNRVFTLTDTLAYAQEYRRPYQSAKEDLYLVALALTLERHLWTPIFASNLRTVYGNYGEAQHFDQAMRFVADLSVSQRLPYGGEFTATMVETLIRDVKKSITASERGALNLDLKVPLLRGAGHVARERLIQLERELTYAVRTFERYRRQQLLIIASSYFDLLRLKQQVKDGEGSLERAGSDFERAQALQDTGTGSLLDTQRAEQRKLEAEADLEQTRESFRAGTDRFKLDVGMPVDEPLVAADLEDIATIEGGIDDGTYPLLARPAAVEDERAAVDVALERRFDLLTARDRIDDAHRGVAISRNALLPDLNWNSTLGLDTDPNHYNIAAFNWERANWRSEIVLGLPLERTAERNDLRRALITVQQAQRGWQEQGERIRAEVRAAVNQLRLQERFLIIQQKNLDVAKSQAEYAALQFADGRIDNRTKIDAEKAVLSAQNALNQAKTSRWVAILGFRLATETLLVEEDGNQTEPPG